LSFPSVREPAALKIGRFHQKYRHRTGRSSSHCVLRVARAVNQVLSPDGLNLVQANGPGAHQSVKHFHIHVLPRKLGDGLKLNWGVKPGDPDTIAVLAEKIRARL
jgi:diadenosine tetraphosphate (Ap4A) HIT family hydrolase